MAERIELWKINVKPFYLPATLTIIIITDRGSLAAMHFFKSCNVPPPAAPPECQWK